MGWWPCWCEEVSPFGECFPCDAGTEPDQIEITIPAGTFGGGAAPCDDCADLNGQTITLDRTDDCVWSGDHGVCNSPSYSVIAYITLGQVWRVDFYFGEASCQRLVRFESSVITNTDCCTVNESAPFLEAFLTPAFCSLPYAVCVALTDATVTITSLCHSAARQSTPAATQAASGKVLVSGSATGTWLMSTQAASGKVLVSGTATQTVPLGTQSGTGKVAITGTIAQTGIVETQAASGTVGIPCVDLDCVFECQAGGWFIQSDGCAVEPTCECPALPTDPCEMENFGETQTLPCQDI